MSDMFNNDGSNEPKNAGTYSYTKDEINQGESYYQWTPYDDGLKARRAKGHCSFAKKLLRTVAIAAVFGIVAGIFFQSVVYVSDRVTGGSSKIEAVKPKEGNSASSPAVSATATTTVATTSNTGLTDVSEIANAVFPAIVQVTNVGLQEYQTFFGPVRQESTSAGSGIIVSQDEDNVYIATNNHVVSGAEKLTITFNDGKSVEGTIKGTDSSCDLAVVSVALKEIDDETLAAIKVATLATTAKPKVGEAAIVIGNAMGYGTSVTSGIISALDREIDLVDDQGEPISNSLIQTSAAVNPGNSGGALLNANSEVIGIVSAKLVDERTEGMGYAIPISDAWTIIQQMIHNDEVSELDASFLGISGRDITKELSEQYNVPVGAYVTRVFQGSGAEKAGIKEKDIITGFNGRKVTSLNTLNNCMKYVKAGETAEITIAKADNHYAEKTIKVTLTHKMDNVQ